MSLILHLIWVGGPLRDLEIETARGLLYAAKFAGATINFFVDGASCSSVKALVNGALSSRAMSEQHLDSGHDFSPDVRFIHIDEDLAPYIRDFIQLPAVNASLLSLFPQASEQELIDFIEFMIRLEQVGPGKNLAAMSDILRAVAILSEGGYYADLDLKLKRMDNPRLPVPDRFRINISGQGVDLEFNNDIIASPAEDPQYLKIFSHFAKQYYYHIAADYIFQSPQKTKLPESRLCKAIASKYISRFAHKRLVDRFYETHLLTGNLAISDYVTQTQRITEDLGFSNTLFEGAKSHSMISWQSKKSYADDSSFRYAHALLAKPLNHFWVKHFDEGTFIEMYFRHLFGLGASHEIIALKMIDFTRVNALTHEIIYSLEKDYVEHVEALFEYYANGSKELHYNGAVRLLNTIHCLKKLQDFSPEPVFNAKASSVIYAILCELMSVRNKLPDPSQYDRDGGKQLEAYYEWCETHLSLFIQAPVDLVQAVRDNCQIM